MARTRKKPAEKLAPVADEVLDQCGPAAGMSMEDINAATRRLKKALMERMLGGELSHHLGYPPGGDKPDDTPNHRNGTSGKTVVTDDGPVAVAVPRDRAGTFEPLLVPKHARRLAGFDDKVLALYARGLPTREVQKFLEEIYGIEVSPTLISEVTDAVLTEVSAWQARPLEPMYPVVFFDALRVKIRDEAVVRSKAVYLALAILPDGARDILGIWIEQTEGVNVHLIRRSLDLVGWKDRKSLAKALRVIYTAASAEAAARELDAFAAGSWGQRFPMIVKSWRQAWTHVIPFFAFPPDVRRVIYTTNQRESVHARVRKVIKTRGHFPTDEAATKLIWLALRNIMAGWTSTASRHWRETVHQFAILFGDRFLREPV
jgi:transposase-like protein